MSSGFLTRSDTNRAVQPPQKIARGLKCKILEEVGLYNYLHSENKGADQLHAYCAADLPLCFSTYAKSRFSHDAAEIKQLFEEKLSKGFPTQTNLDCADTEAS